MRHDRKVRIMFLRLKTNFGCWKQSSGNGISSRVSRDLCQSKHSHDKHKCLIDAGNTLGIGQVNGVQL
jgi:hypothetical protein